MNPWLLALIILISVFVVVGTAVAVLYFVVLPKLLVKKIRGGKEQLTFSENFDSIAAKVNAVRNLAYASQYPNSVYDWYTPKDAQAKPLVVWVHGGFFVAGDKFGVSNVCTAIAAEGYPVAAINYAVAPEHKYPAAIKQIDDFIVHMLSNFSDAVENGVVLAGDSAGGQLALQYALSVHSAQLKLDMGFKPNLAAAALKGIALVCAPIDVADLFGAHKLMDFLLPTFGRAYFGSGRWHRSQKFKSSHLFHYVGAELPPVFLTDGNRVSFESQNKKLGARLRDNGVAVDELYFDADKHGVVNHEYLFDMTQDASHLGMQRLLAYLAQVGK